MINKKHMGDLPSYGPGITQQERRTVFKRHRTGSGNTKRGSAESMAGRSPPQTAGHHLEQNLQRLVLLLQRLGLVVDVREHEPRELHLPR